MDELDFQIFRGIGFRPYGPHSGDPSRLDPWKIAKKLGVDGKTVKLRLKRMEKGFIKYYQVYPNYELMGVKGSAYFFEMPEIRKKYEALEKISLVDGVVEIYNFAGNAFCIDFAYRDAPDRDRRLALFKELSNCSSCIKFYDRDMPATHIGLKSLDWRIIKSLRFDAFKRPSKVADELGLSIKTVRKRLQRMTDNNAIIIVPVIHPGEIPDTISYGLLFFLDEERREETVRSIFEAFQQTYFLAFTPLLGNLMLLNVARTLGETEDALLQAKSIGGVVDVRQLVLKELREYTEWMDREIERKIEETKAIGLRR